MNHIQFNAVETRINQILTDQLISINNKPINLKIFKQMKFFKSQILLSEYIDNVRADRLDEWSMDDLGRCVMKLEDKYKVAFENNSSLKIGDKFFKNLSKGKYAECEIIDIINRISTVNCDCKGVEYWAKCISENYSSGQTFEVAKATVIRGKVIKRSN